MTQCHNLYLLWSRFVSFVTLATASVHTACQSHHFPAEFVLIAMDAGMRQHDNGNEARIDHRTKSMYPIYEKFSHFRKLQLQTDLTSRLADRMKELRSDKGWSLDQLAAESGISRATLSRLENADVSPTTEVLGRLCTAYGLSLSRLMTMVEDSFPALVRRDRQPEWTDDKAGFRRRSVSPPAGQLAAEVLECELAPGTRLSYDAPSVPGQEHHLLMQEGKLDISIEGRTHKLQPGDCLRYQLYGTSEFTTGENLARYILVLL